MGLRSFRRSRVVTILAATAVVSALVVTKASGAGFLGFGTAHVGRQSDGTILLPDNEQISPAGRQIPVNGRLISSKLRPDGHTMAALTWQNFTGYLSIIDVANRTVLQQVGASGPAIGDGTVSFDGPLYSSDGQNLWVPQGADLVHFKVAADGTVSNPVAIAMVGGPGGALIPSGMAFSADGSRLYVALNGANALGVVDTVSNTLLRQIPVGNAPRQVVVVGATAYVSNEGGRPANSSDFTNLSFGTPIVSSASTGAAITGSVSVVDLAGGTQTASISVGLHPNALLLVGHDLLVANSNDDTVSAIDTTTSTVRQTFNVNPLPMRTVGAAPNALAMLDSTHLLVSLGRDNALAEFTWNGSGSPAGLVGLIPTGWYPVAIERDDALGQMVVTNDKGVGSLGPAQTITQGPGTHPATGRNVYADVGTVSLLATPLTSRSLQTWTAEVFANNRWYDLLSNNQPARTHVAPTAVPANLGEPSTIKHVFLIIKENRTYDQVLGDLPRGNGDPKLTQFGSLVTPNQHALAATFPLLDNMYAAGTLSADGHNWLVQANANDYIEKEFGTFYRSYPAQGADALAYQRDGFLWNAARLAGVPAADWGEYANFLDGPSPAPSWSSWYHDSQVLEGKIPGPLKTPIGTYKSRSDIPSLNAIMHPDYPKFDLTIPDQYRTDLFLRDFNRYEQAGTLPGLNLLWVMTDHTSGVAPGLPIPTAAVADNDLAVGRMVDAISHSPDWSSSAIFVVEDDAQDGTDHVDGHRTTALVISPYARRNVEIPTYYNQINLVRTIEQILGIRPMNQLDLAAVPMREVFTSARDTAPFTAVPNNVPLDLLGPPAASLTGVAAQWAAWSAQQNFRQQDQVNPAQLNRAIWYSTSGWTTPYPGDSRVLAPNEVPGRNRPVQELDG